MKRSRWFVVALLGLGWLAVGSTAERVEVDALVRLAARLTADCVAASDRCPHLVYVHSPSMPLSERGTADIAEAASALDVPVSTLRAEALFGPSTDPTAEALRTALVEAGATVHYPAVVVTARGQPVGNALVGYKRAEVYRALLRERLASHDPTETAPAVQGAAEATADVRVLASIELPTPPGAFFRRVPGTRRISFDVRYEVYLHHLETGDRFRAPGRLDFVPSPDGLFFVTPATGRSGTEFYDRHTLFALGQRGEGRSLAPLFVDETMNDEYPSVGILHTGAEGQASRYRVLVAWNRGPAYRDYDVRVHPGRGVAAIEPVGPKTPACPGRDLSLPILSKDGVEMSARDERSGTTKVYRIGPDLCEELFDTGLQTSKATFSPDGRLLAFGARNAGPAATGDGRNAVYVLDRETEALARVPQSLSASLTIPEFVGPDSLLFLVTSGERRTPVRLRLVCCVR